MILSALLLSASLFTRLCHFSMNMVKSHLLSRNTLSSTIIGVIPREPADDDKVRVIY